MTDPRTFCDRCAFRLPLAGPFARCERAAEPHGPGCAKDPPQVRANLQPPRQPAPRGGKR